MNSLPASQPKRQLRQIGSNLTTCKVFLLLISHVIQNYTTKTFQGCAMMWNHNIQVDQISLMITIIRIHIEGVRGEKEVWMLFINLTGVSIKVLRRLSTSRITSSWFPSANTSKPTKVKTDTVARTSLLIGLKNSRICLKSSSICKRAWISRQPSLTISSGKLLCSWILRQDHRLKISKVRLKVISSITTVTGSEGILFLLQWPTRQIKARLF